MELSDVWLAVATPGRVTFSAEYLSQHPEAIPHLRRLENRGVTKTACNTYHGRVEAWSLSRVRVRTIDELMPELRARAERTEGK